MAGSPFILHFGDELFTISFRHFKGTPFADGSEGKMFEYWHAILIGVIFDIGGHWGRNRVDFFRRQWHHRGYCIKTPLLFSCHLATPGQHFFRKCIDAGIVLFINVLIVIDVVVDSAPPGRVYPEECRGRVGIRVCEHKRASYFYLILVRCLELEVSTAVDDR